MRIFAPSPYDPYTWYDKLLVAIFVLVCLTYTAYIIAYLTL